MSKPLQQLSGDAQRRLEEFSTEFTAAYEAVDPTSEWSVAFGLVKDSRSMKLTFPAVISAAGYKREEGDDKLRSLYQRSFSVTPEKWIDGVVEDPWVLEQDDFSGWADEPGRIAREARRLPNQIVAAILEANPALDFYRDKTTGGGVTKSLFATDHPNNIFDSAFGTFSNLLVQADTGTATSLNSAVMKAVFRNMATRKGANGKFMRLRPDTLFCSPNREEECKDFLASDLDRLVHLEGGVGTQKNTQLSARNRWMNSINLVCIDELTSTSDHLIYFLDSRAGSKPWVVQTGGTPEEIRYGFEDALYKDKGLVGVKYKLLMGAAAAMPHAITRVNLNA